MNYGKLTYPFASWSFILKGSVTIPNISWTIGLIKAIDSFWPDKGTKLAAFAARCIENESLIHLRSLKKTRKDVSLHDPIGTDKEENKIWSGSRKGR